LHQRLGELEPVAVAVSEEGQHAVLQHALADVGCDPLAAAALLHVPYPCTTSLVSQGNAWSGRVGCRRGQYDRDHERERTAAGPGQDARRRRQPCRDRRLHPLLRPTDRKSTRLNSSHVSISYAVFCLKKKKK